MGPEVAAAAGAAAGTSAISPGLATALMVGGTGAQMLAAKQQQKEQRSILNRAFDRQNETAKDSTSQTVEAAQGMSAEGQKAAMRAAEDAAYQRTMADLEGSDFETAGQGGAVFQQALADRAAQEDARLSQIARQTASVRAPADVQQQEAMKRGALAEKLGSLWRSTQNASQAAQMDAQDVDAPLYGDLGKIAALVGGASLAAGAGEAATAANGAGSVGMADSVYQGANVASGGNSLFAAQSPMFANLKPRRAGQYGVVR